MNSPDVKCSSCGELIPGWLLDRTTRHGIVGPIPPAVLCQVCALELAELCTSVAASPHNGATADQVAALRATADRLRGRCS